MLKRRFVAVALSVALIGGVAESATAKPAKRTITAEAQGLDGLRGQVESKKEKCFNKVFVQIIDSATDMQVQSFFTNMKGKFKTRQSLDPGSYRVEAPRLGGCKKAASEDVIVGPFR